MSPSGETVIEVEGLRMRYGANDVLRGVTFRAHQGEVLAMLGPNGAGKTTTIEILEGFRMRSAGHVSVLGQDPAHGDENWRSRIGIVLQSWRDHGKWRVRELLAHLGTYYAGHSTERVTRPWDAAELIALVGLGEHADKQIRMLSGGQRRRLDVAIGMVGRPELLFLDEPTAGFDPEARHEFHDLILGLAAAGDTTIMLTTHDLAEADKLADRIVILNHGRIVADGTAAELAEQIVGEDEVRWTLDGQRYVRSVKDSTGFVRGLFEEHGTAVSGLAVRPSSLEDTYLALVHRAESGEGGPPPEDEDEAEDGGTGENGDGAGDQAKESVR
ncbi:ABC transporter ATP-binding protein [Actinomadura logoneensis]|uniref:ABC transporter ATP-binding protein n=1 Tax=Actinomadura logoneensis TaxID=2293572 RepID=A0A372JCG2_9ACTN|nr:ABC transporter ATP-binding protein [Actinomadura logoneensis]RFU37078.1 ABC transporter ATP-binding protein [Actinomadura logoneensis]